MPHKHTFGVLSFSIFLSLFWQNSAIKTSPSCPLIPTNSNETYNSPINIITKDVQKIHFSTPVNLLLGVIGPLLVKNTGLALEVYGNPEVISGGRLFGGVLCGVIYTFHKLRFYISKDLDGRSYNQLDGKGSPLTIALHYWNLKYPSFEEAIHHPDGVVIVTYMLTYKPFPNLLFILDDILIRLLFHYPGAQAYVTEILLYAWFDIIIPITNEYYGFPGSYLDLETGTQYPCAYIIQTSKIYPLLSKEQLEAFQSLLNRNGTKIETVAPLQETGNRKIISGLGFTQTPSII